MLYLADRNFNILQAPIEKEYFVIKAFEPEEAIATLKDHLDESTPKNSFVVGHVNPPEYVPVDFKKRYGVGDDVFGRTMDFIGIATGGYSGGWID